MNDKIVLLFDIQSWAWVGRKHTLTEKEGNPAVSDVSRPPYNAHHPTPARELANCFVNVKSHKNQEGLVL